MRPNRFVAASSAAVTLALCAGLSASAAASSSSAPVIHEHFTLLPCPKKPTTTTQIEGCAEHKVVAADKQIDALDVKVFARLRRTGRRAFVTATNDWVTYRDAVCTSEASIYSGGTIQPVAYANCLISIDNSHVSELKQMLIALSPEG